MYSKKDNVKLQKWREITKALKIYREEAMNLEYLDAQVYGYSLVLFILVNKIVN